jgi:hypothetical protein
MKMKMFFARVLLITFFTILITGLTAALNNWDINTTLRLERTEAAMFAGTK